MSFQNYYYNLGYELEKNANVGLQSQVSYKSPGSLYADLANKERDLDPDNELELTAAMLGVPSALLLAGGLATDSSLLSILGAIGGAGALGGYGYGKLDNMYHESSDRRFDKEVSKRALGIDTDAPKRR